MRKAFVKQIKTTKDKEKKQIEALENLKPKEHTKTIKDKHSTATIIFNDLINKKNILMNEFHESFDKKKLYFE